MVERNKEKTKQCQHVTGWTWKHWDLVQLCSSTSPDTAGQDHVHTNPEGISVVVCNLILNFMRGMF